MTAGNEIRKAMARKGACLSSIALFVYLTVIVIAASPPSPFRNLCNLVFKPLFNYFGLYNSYGVFAPDPANYNQVFRAVIEFEDGSRKNWFFPCLTEWKHDELMRNVKLAWEEWEYYFMWSSDNRVLINDAAKYLAWVYRNPQNPPVRVYIYRDYSQIVPPARENELPGQPRTTTQELLEYVVHPEDLQEGNPTNR